MQKYHAIFLPRPGSLARWARRWLCRTLAPFWFCAGFPRLVFSFFCVLIWLLSWLWLPIMLLAKKSTLSAYLGRGSGEAGVKASSVSCSSACSGVLQRVVKNGWLGETTWRRAYGTRRDSRLRTLLVSFYFTYFFMVAVISCRKDFPAFLSAAIFFLFFFFF